VNTNFNPYEDTLNLPFFIAEIGINHNGDVKLAKKLIDVAVESGCNAVKFQKREIDTVYTKEYLESARQSPWGTTQRQQKEGLEFGKAEYDEIDSYCKKKNIMWSASAWDLESQEFLKQYDLPFNKIASAMLTHVDLLESVASEGKHTFISTGMSSYTDIDRAVEIFRSENCPFTLFHTVSTYPSKDEDCNINMIKSLSDRYGVPVGYSGHEAGTVPSLLAVAIGAAAIERHITLDKKMYGSDQSASIEPDELDFLLFESRKVTNTMGTGQKVFLQHEVPVAQKLRYFEAPDQLRVLNE
jgi:N-acetylneuraminate synthase